MFVNICDVTDNMIYAELKLPMYEYSLLIVPLQEMLPLRKEVFFQIYLRPSFQSTLAQRNQVHHRVSHRITELKSAEKHLPQYAEFYLTAAFVSPFLLRLAFFRYTPISYTANFLLSNKHDCFAMAFVLTHKLSK